MGTHIEIPEGGETQQWVRNLGETARWDRIDISGAVVESVPASAEDVDPPPYAVAAAAAVKEEPEVSDVESEGVPGSGEPFPAAAVTLVPAAKR